MLINKASLHAYTIATYGVKVCPYKITLTENTLKYTSGTDFILIIFYHPDPNPAAFVAESIHSTFPKDELNNILDRIYYYIAP